MISPYFYSKFCRRKLRPDVYEVSKRLTQRGHKIVVVTSKTYGVPSYEIIEDIQIHRVSSLALPKIYYFIPHIPRFIDKVLEICKKNDIEILHFWNYEYLTSVLTLFLRKKLQNIPFIITIIGFPGLNWKYGAKIVDLAGLAYTYTIGKTVLKTVDHVILLGRNLIKYALWMGVPAEKISINSFGIDFQEFRPTKKVEEVRKELGISPSEKVVIFVGRLEPVKGIKYFLKAARFLCKKMRNIKFLIVGDGPLRSELQAYSIPQIIFTGWRNDVPNLLNASDLFVLPSLSEGLPLSILEACAIGKPIVATNVGAVNEIVIHGYNGILVSPKNWKQLIKAIQYLINNPELMQEMGLRGKDLVEKKYDWNTILNIYEEIYQSLAR